jgi:CRP-like cAMP-binding protein
MISGVNAVILVVWGLVGLASLGLGAIITYRGLKRSYAFPSVGGEPDEPRFLDEIRKRGVAELEQTQAGRELLAIYRDALAQATDTFKLLRAMQPLSSLTDEEIKLLSSNAELRTFERDEIIFREGESSDTLFIIVEGHVLIYKSDEAGEKFEVMIFSDGEFFGEMALLDDKPRSASAQAITPTTALTLDRQAFTSAVSAAPNISLAVMRTVSLRLRGFTNYAQQLARLLASTPEPKSELVDVILRDYEKLFAELARASEQRIRSDPTQTKGRGQTPPPDRP